MSVGIASTASGPRRWKRNRLEALRHRLGVRPTIRSHRERGESTTHTRTPCEQLLAMTRGCARAQLAVVKSTPTMWPAIESGVVADRWGVGERQHEIAPLGNVLRAWVDCGRPLLALGKLKRCRERPGSVGHRCAAIAEAVALMRCRLGRRALLGCRGHRHARMVRVHRVRLAVCYSMLSMPTDRARHRKRSRGNNATPHERCNRAHSVGPKTSKHDSRTLRDCGPKCQAREAVD